MDVIWPALAPAQDVHAFLEQILWGRARYVVIRSPAALEESARACGTRRVAGTLDGVEVNLAINRAPVLSEAFLWAGASLQRRLRLEAGDPVQGRLAPVDPSVVPLPDDVAAALHDPAVRAAWDQLTPAVRRQRLAPIEAAAKPETRARRIDEAVRALGG